MKHFNEPKSRRRPKKQMLGLTLLEVITVIFLIALAFGIAVPNYNNITHVRLKKSATQLGATIRYLYNQAALKGLCMRLVFDLHNDSYLVEASTDGECLVDGEQTSARKARRKEQDAKKKKKERKNAAPTDSTVGGWSGEKPISLEHKKTVFAQYNDHLLKPRKLESRVRFHAVYTIHQKEPYSRKSGPRLAYLHCFPLGRCERAVIFLEDSGGSIYSLEIKPLTGRVIIHRGKMKLSDSFKDRKKGADDAP